MCASDKQRLFKFLSSHRVERVLVGAAGRHCERLLESLFEAQAVCLLTPSLSPSLLHLLEYRLF